MQTSSSAIKEVLLRFEAFGDALPVDDPGEVEDLMTSAQFAIEREYGRESDNYERVRELVRRDRVFSGMGLNGIAQSLLELRGFLAALDRSRSISSDEPRTSQKAKKGRSGDIIGGRWRIERPIPGGRGGQGVTYVVSDVQSTSGAEFALKLLKGSDAKRISRFRSEIDAIKKLNHPNVLKVIDASATPEDPYLVTEYCTGGNLQELMATEQIPIGKWLTIYIQVVEGVDHAHSNKPRIVHRDIKPPNILLRYPGGPAVVADFGICFVEGGERLTHIREKVGPRDFVAPELEFGRVEDVRPSADVYSLGKLLYWMISRGNIFPRERFRDREYNLRELLRDDRMEHLNRFLDYLVIEDPADRYQDAGMVLQEARKLRSVILGGYNAVSATIPQTCTYCGQGKYRLLGRGDVPFLTVAEADRARDFRPPDWRVFYCIKCGHLQVFDYLHAERKDWWDEDKA